MRPLFLLLLPFLAFAQDASILDSLKSLLEQFKGGEASNDDFTITSHTVHIDGQPISYSAITGSLEQYTESGEVPGRIFFTAYLKEQKEENRPITFIFNGGPGGSALSMHIGGMGPRRLLFPEEGQKTLPPYRLTDNNEAILDISDIVFVDPMCTGFSKLEKDEYKLAYYSVEGDLYSFTEFVRMFCIHFDRWNHPKYLMGASYGTCRACGLAESLADAGIHLNGIVLMSSVLDFQTHQSTRDNPLPDCLLLPTLAATSWHHKRTMQDRTLAQVVEYARRFAYEEYAPVMMQPTRLSPIEQKVFYQKLSDLIGLPVDTIRRYEGRIDERIYVSEFFATQRKIIGGVDSRYVGEKSAISNEYNEDPSYRDFRPAFYPAFLNYLKTELETEYTFPKYINFSHEAFMFWNWSTYDSPGSMPNFMQRLRRTLVVNPHMKVFLGSGYYDIRTPFAASEHSIDHLELPASYRRNFQVEYYEAGHGYIFDLPSLKKFKKDLVKFYAN